MQNFVRSEEHDGCSDFFGLALRPSGTSETNCTAACFACSGGRPALSSAGVSIRPGLSAFARILRSLSSIAQAARNATAALLAA